MSNPNDMRRRLVAQSSDSGLSLDARTYDRGTIAALQANAPTADDIVGNEAFLDELNYEVGYTQAQLDGTAPPAAPVEDEPDLSPLADMRPHAVAPPEPQRFRPPPGSSRPQPAPEPIILEPGPLQMGTPNSLEDDLAALEAQVEEARKRAEAARAAAAEAAEAEGPRLTQEEIIKGQIMELLRSTKGAPGERQIEAWKAQFGQNGVHVIALGEGDVYIFTHLRRGQWKRIQEVIAKMAQTDLAGKADEMLQEKVVQNCVIWPKHVNSVEWQVGSRAGVMQVLFDAIMLHSYFLTPQQAMQLTTSF